MTLYRKAATCFVLIMALGFSLIACTPKSTQAGSEPNKDYVSMVKCPVIKGTIASTFRVPGTVAATE